MSETKLNYTLDQLQKAIADYSLTLIERGLVADLLVMHAQLSRVRAKIVKLRDVSTKHMRSKDRDTYCHGVDIGDVLDAIERAMEETQEKGK